MALRGRNEYKKEQAKYGKDRDDKFRAQYEKDMKERFETKLNWGIKNRWEQRALDDIMVNKDVKSSLKRDYQFQ